MRPIDVALGAVAVFSAVMISYEWLKIWGIVNPVINFYSGLMIAAIAALILRRR